MSENPPEACLTDIFIIESALLLPKITIPHPPAGDGCSILMSHAQSTAANHDLIPEVISLLEQVDLSELLPATTNGARQPAATPLQATIQNTFPEAFSLKKTKYIPGTQRSTVTNTTTTEKPAQQQNSRPLSHDAESPAEPLAAIKIRWNKAALCVTEDIPTEKPEHSKQGEVLQGAIVSVLDTPNVPAMDHLVPALKDFAALVLDVCEAKDALTHVPTELLLKLTAFLETLIRAGATEDIDWSGKGAASMRTCQTALVATTILLRLMATEAIPPQVRGEEAMDLCIQATRHQLQFNVLPAIDDRHKTTRHVEKEASKTAKKNTIRSRESVSLLEQDISEVLGLLASLLPIVKMQTSSILPLIRTCISAMAADNLNVLQTKATAFLASVFNYQPELRQTMFNDIFTLAIPLLHAKKTPARYYIAAECNGQFVKVQVVTSAVLQMVQNCIQLPPLGTPANLLSACSNHAVWAADYFWSLCFEKLLASRTDQTDNTNALRLVLDSIVQDLLTVIDAPQWPGASFLLLRLVTFLNSARGLQHPDPLVRQMSVDLLGGILTSLQTVQIKTNKDKIWLEKTVDFEGSTSIEDTVHKLLFACLTEKSNKGTKRILSAQQFWLVRLFAEEVTDLSTSAMDPQQLLDILQRYHKRQEEFALLTIDDAFTEDDAWKLMRLALQGTLGRASQAMLQWLLDLLNPKLQGPATRAKALKALGDVVAANTDILQLEIVHAAVEQTLQDDAVSVREASVNLIGRHIADDANLAVQFYNILVRASEDSGASVRRCAIRLLHDCCIRVADFPYATDACRAIIMRAGDTEESVQNNVSKVFHNLWFNETLNELSTATRAKQLATVAAAVYDAGGRAIHVPLESTHPLVAVLQNAMTWGSKGDLDKETHAGRLLATALLDHILAAGTAAAATSDGALGNSFGYLIALHALARADIALCIPDNDPTKFVRCLAPYLKDNSNGSREGEQQRHSTEQLLCVLSLVSDISTGLAATTGVVIQDDIAVDLVSLVNHHRYTQVMAEACKCLCSLAANKPLAESRLGSLAAVYWNWLQRPDDQHPGHIPRFLFIFGQLCRHGFDLLERLDFTSAFQPLTVDTCLRMFLRFHRYNKPSAEMSRIQKCALEGLGLFAVARPALLASATSPAGLALGAALRVDAPMALKLAALNSLVEILEADADDLHARQRQALPPGKAKLKRTRSAVEAAEQSTAVPVQNGEDDALSLSGAVIQAHWDAVIKLASDVSPDGTLTHGASVRRGVITVMEVVSRDGLVGPWTAVSALVVLATDPVEDIRSRALKLLRALGDKYPRYLDADRLLKGLTQVYEFHKAFAKVSPIYRFSAPLAPAALLGLETLYSELVWPNRQLKNEFIKGLVRAFKGELIAAKNSKSATSTLLDLNLFAFYVSAAAALPLKRGDEACTLIHESACILQSYGDDVLHDLQNLVEGGGGGTKVTSTSTLQQQATRSLLLAMLAVLVNYCRRAYAINMERAAACQSGGDRRKQEERLVISRDDTEPFSLSELDLEAVGDVERCRKHCGVLERLLSEIHFVAAVKAPKAGRAKKPAAPRSASRKQQPKKRKADSDENSDSDYEEQIKAARRKRK